jgi:V/A-type H+-transporting ATPase subunit I
MRWRDRFGPVAMQRVALLAPAESARDLLVHVADVGAVQLESPSDAADGPATALLGQLPPNASVPTLASGSPDLDWCVREGRRDLVAGEAELETKLQTGVRNGRVIGFVGWARADEVARLREQVAPVGGAVVGLPRPPGMQPPTLLSDSGPGRSFTPLVETYATPAYRDIDPSFMAGLAYVVMFGMMFADLGHGALVLLVALVARFGHWRRVEPLRRVWVLLAAAGAFSMVFGALYGEFFGPTHAFPVVWLAPLDRPIPLLLAAVGVGAVLLGASYVVGSLNRFREGGWRVAVYAPSGLAGAALFVGLGVLVAGTYWHQVLLVVAGACGVAAAVTVAFIGYFTEAGGGFAGTAQASVESFDMVIRLGSNIVSFARLAAFGMTHAALGQLVWQATVGTSRHGPLAIVGAVVIFAVGNALTFGLEALIAAVQALRLEYYELFSRVFGDEGEPFRPWHLPVEAGLPPHSSPLEA